MSLFMSILWDVEMNVVIAATECRRRIHGILHGMLACFWSRWWYIWMLNCMTVRVMQAWMAGEQLDYTYTPAEQNRATMPKPPRVLARMATSGSRRASLSFGSLWKYEHVSRVCKMTRTWKSRTPGQKSAAERGRQRKAGERWERWGRRRGEPGGEPAVASVVQPV